MADFRGGLFPGGRRRRDCRATEGGEGAGLRCAAKRRTADHARLFSRVTLQLGPLLDARATRTRGWRPMRLKRCPVGLTISPAGALLRLCALPVDRQLARYDAGESAGPVGCGHRQSLKSKYTINVNTEMNYWLAEPAALGETSIPLFNLLDVARTTGTAMKVARRTTRRAAS